MAGLTERLRWAELAGYAMAAAGLVAAVSFDVARAVYLFLMAVAVFALVPVMIGFGQLADRTQQSRTRVVLAVGALGVVGYVALSVALAMGLVTFDSSRAADGLFALLAFSMLLLGLALAAANVLGGPWPTPIPRWLGVLSGIAWVLTGIGLLVAGSPNLLTTVGGFGYQLIFPIWGAVIGRRFAAVRSDAT